ncbi:MAG TPA: glycosyltransferase [Chryseosolibacter sp.]
MINVAFYTPVSFRCRDIESLASKFIQEGMNVFLISYDADGEFQKACNNLGVQLITIEKRKPGSFRALLKEVKSVIVCCKNRNIKVLYSHLEPTNFVSVLAQWFMSTKVIIFRHHIDEAALYKFDKSWAYRITYKFARTIICVSRQAKTYMIKSEGVPEERIKHIDLGYDFRRYWTLDRANIERLRLRNAGAIKLITAGRLTSFKRPVLALEVLKHLIHAKGMDVTLTYLGAGEQESDLRSLAEKYQLQQNVYFEGYRHNVADYFHASDFLLHPSLLESSCVVIKEAGLARLPVIVCKGVGDFDDYMRHEQNGIVVEPGRFVEEAITHVQQFLNDPGPYRQQAVALHDLIERKFSIETVFDKHLTLIQSM